MSFRSYCRFFLGKMATNTLKNRVFWRIYTPEYLIEQTRELFALFSYVNICLDNGNSYFHPLPPKPKIQVYRQHKSFKDKKVRSVSGCKGRSRCGWQGHLPRCELATLCAADDAWIRNILCLLTASHSTCKQGFAMSDCQYHLYHHYYKFPLFFYFLCWLWSDTHLTGGMELNPGLYISISKSWQDFGGSTLPFSTQT